VDPLHLRVLDGERLRFLGDQPRVRVVGACFGSCFDRSPHRVEHAQPPACLPGSRRSLSQGPEKSHPRPGVAPTLPAMKLAIHMGYWGGAPIDVMPLISEAERLGFDSVWSAEAYGSDAVTTVAWVAARTERIGVGTAIMQIPARTPSSTAMTAITLDHLSGGRFRLGLGMSGPQVVEGWHGVPYGKPLARTREYVEVVRAILRRDKPVEHS